MNIQTFDFERFLRDKFKTPKGLIAFLNAYGVTPPNEAAVNKWFLRKGVPGDWLPVLLAYLQVEDGELKLSTYLKRGE